MLQLLIPKTEIFNESTNEFINVKETTLNLEHSLISISKWESKYCKPFLSKEPKTVDETLYYIKCMTIGNVDPNVYKCIDNDMMDQINEYISAPMTATKFYNLENERPNRRTITSELIYYWMISGNVPVEFEKWHINRLLTLIKVISIENDPNAKKLRGRELLKHNHRLNEMRRKALHSKG